jgi:pSer/pThr/pTyr-binding forkhead associated (FHA) protein
MALILEIRDSRGVPTWRHLDGRPLTLGRALSNDVILDDPYLDAHHARIWLGESGVVEIDDLSSVNGLHTNGSRVQGPLTVQAGAEVRIGRTTLRFRDVDEAVAPALVDDHTSSIPLLSREISGAPTKTSALLTPVSGRASLRSRLLGTTAGRLSIVAVMIAAFACNTWLGETGRSSGGSIFAAAMAVTFMASLWATAWNVAGRGTHGRVHFLEHLALVSLALLAMLAWDTVNDWLTFLFPDAKITSVLYSVVFLVVVAVVIAGHIAVSTALSRKARWQVVLVVSGTMIVLFTLAGLVNEDKFTDVPKFASQLEPLSPRFVPTKTVDEFGGEMRKLKDEVDEALKKQGAP